MGWHPSLKTDKKSSQDLSAGALSYTTDFGRRCKLESVSVQFSVPVTETVTVTLDSVNGASYDVILASESLASESSFVFRPFGEMNLQAGDQVKVTCTNANLTGTAYVVVKSSEILI